MRLSTILSLTLTYVSMVSAAGPIEIYITQYHTVDLVETVTQTSTQVVLETQYVN
jgi:hypothetical protein